jgi:hypothetical protein
VMVNTNVHLLIDLSSFFCLIFFGCSYCRDYFRSF